MQLGFSLSPMSNLITSGGRVRGNLYNLSTNQNHQNWLISIQWNDFQSQAATSSLQLWLHSKKIFNKFNLRLVFFDNLILNNFWKKIETSFLTLFIPNGHQNRARLEGPVTQSYPNQRYPNPDSKHYDRETRIETKGYKVPVNLTLYKNYFLI